MSKDTGVKVKVIHDFFDRENDLILREAGTQFTAPPDRADYLKNLGYVEVVKLLKTKKTALKSQSKLSNAV